MTTVRVLVALDPFTDALVGMLRDRVLGLVGLGATATEIAKTGVALRDARREPALASCRLSADGRRRFGGGVLMRRGHP